MYRIHTDIRTFGEDTFITSQNDAYSNNQPLITKYQMYYKLLQTREYGNYRDMTVLLGHEIPMLTLQIIEKAGVF